MRRGGVEDQEGVSQVRCAEAEVELHGVVPWNVDGELIEAGSSAFHVDPDAVDAVVP
jgi:diacylglycerol kinase family enzyme